MLNRVFSRIADRWDNFMPHLNWRGKLFLLAIFPVSLIATLLVVLSTQSPAKAILARPPVIYQFHGDVVEAYQIPADGHVLGRPASVVLRNIQVKTGVVDLVFPREPYGLRVKRFTDVPVGQPNWARQYFADGFLIAEVLEIHVHDFSEFKAISFKF